MTLLKIRNPTWQLAALSVVVVLFLAAPLYYGSAPKEPDSAKALRALFIGNSLTYSNDLPSVVEALAKAAGQRKFAYKTIAFPDFSLEDHWNKKDAGKAIMKGGWDLVVLQQGPSAAKEGRALLLEYARRFAEDIRRIGARPALYSVWASIIRRQDFKGVGDSWLSSGATIEIPADQAVLLQRAAEEANKLFARH